MLGFTLDVKATGNDSEACTQEDCSKEFSVLKELIKTIFLYLKPKRLKTKTQHRNL